jgi:hypothetical protein
MSTQDIENQIRHMTQSMNFITNAVFGHEVETKDDNEANKEEGQNEQ